MVFISLNKILSKAKNLKVNLLNTILIIKFYFCVFFFKKRMKNKNLEPAAILKNLEIIAKPKHDFLETINKVIEANNQAANKK